MFWMGIVLAACGIFLLVYGGLLFRFALAVGFFVLGLLIAGRNWLEARANQRLRERRLHEHPPAAPATA